MEIGFFLKLDSYQEGNMVFKARDSNQKGNMIFKARDLNHG